MVFCCEKSPCASKRLAAINKMGDIIAEHPFGTIKRQWGFSYILTKRGINHASSDVGFMFIAYNFRRIISILGKDQLMKYLRILASLFLTITAFFRRKLSRLGTFLFQDIICPVQIQLSLKSLWIDRKNFS